jgi:hypothetical protein
MGVCYRVLAGVLVALLVTIAGLRGPATAETANAHSRLVNGYAYVCDGAAQVQEMQEVPGAMVVVTENVDVQNSANNMFEVFQASQPEKCADMAAPFSGAVPGTLLVVVTWAKPRLANGAPAPESRRMNSPGTSGA